MPKTARTPFCLLVAIVACLLTPAHAIAQTTYFVRTTGSDSNDGLTPQSALRTIGEAESEAGPGDTVYVGAGIYNERINGFRDGTAANPIRFIADTSGVHTGDAGEVRVRNAMQPVDLNMEDHLVYIGFVFERTGGSGRVAFVRNLVGVRFIDCQFLGGTGVLVDDASVSFDRVEVRDGSSTAFLVDNGSTVVLNDVTVRNFSGDAIRAVESRVEVYGGQIHDISGIGVFVNAGELIVANAIIRNISGHAISTKNLAVQGEVWHTVVQAIGGDGINHDGGTIRVGNSVFTNLGTAMRRTSGTINNLHNLYHANAANYVGLTAGSGEITGDPRFEPGGFTPALGSPLIDAGTAPPAFAASDAIGTPRPGSGGYDIGAFERLGYTPGELPYFNDFESDIGDEWTDTRVDETEGFSRFLGRHGRETRRIDGRNQWVHSDTTLRVRTTPGERYYFVFDLLVIDSWDADSTQWGPDGFEVLLDGTIFREGYLSRGAGWMGVLDEGMSASGPRGYVSRWDDAILRSATFEFVATRAITQITWRGTPNQGISDESWGLDNVHVFHEDEADELLPMFTDITASRHFGRLTTDSDSSPSSVHWFDADNDGDLDVLMGGRWARLMLSYDWGLWDVWGTSQSMPFGQAIADVDNDGDLDIIAVAGPGGVEGVFPNPGWGIFDPAAFDPMELNWPAGGEAVLAADLNRDGWIDMFFPAQNGNWAALNRRDPTAPDGEVARIFDEQTELEMGLHAPGSYGDGNFASSADWNGDGQLDFLSHFNGGWAFASNPDRRSWTDSTQTFTMTTGDSNRTGSAWADYDNDGDLDVFIGSRSASERGRLYRNTPQGFVDVAESAGLTHAAPHAGAAWGDIDNDGDLDLYIATTAGANLLYRNEGDGTFTLIDRGGAIVGGAHDACFADYDGDGDVDLAISGRGLPATLLRNDTDDGRGIRVRVRGAGAGGTNAAGVGVRIDLRTPDGDFLQRRDLGLARGFGGTEPLEAHFGGIEQGTDYELWVYLARGVTRVPFTGGDVRSELAGRTIERLLIVIETDVLPIRQIVRWGEMGPDETSLARQGRGLTQRGVTLRRAGRLDAQRLTDALLEQGIDEQAIERIGRRDGGN